MKVIEWGVISCISIAVDSMYCRSATVEGEMEVTFQTDTVFCGFYLDGKQSIGRGGGGDSEHAVFLIAGNTCRGTDGVGGMGVACEIVGKRKRPGIVNAEVGYSNPVQVLLQVCIIVSVTVFIVVGYVGTGSCQCLKPVGNTILVGIPPCLTLCGDDTQFLKVETLTASVFL